MSVLSARSVHYQYGGTPALRGVSLDLPSTGSVAIVGSSGSGKSTLLQCLAGIHRPSSGEVVYDGRSMGELTEAQRSELRLRHFGFVFQFGYLVPELSLRENVALPIWLGGTSRRQANEEAAETLDQLGIGDLADRIPSAVSGGQMQRAAVARALAHRPSVVFADEPTGALDSVNSNLVFDALLQHAGRVGALLVVVTHEEDLAARCDTVVVLTDGQVSDVHHPANRPTADGNVDPRHADRPTDAAAAASPADFGR